MAPLLKKMEVYKNLELCIILCMTETDISKIRSVCSVRKLHNLFVIWQCYNFDSIIILFWPQFYYKNWIIWWLDL